MHSIRLGVLDFQPWWFYTNGKTVVRNGDFIMLLKDIYDYFIREFNTTIVTSADGFFGVETGNGSWNGLMGMTQRSEIDVVVLPTFPTTQHLKAVNFLSPIYYTYTTILSGARKIKPTVDGRYIITAFENEVWTGLWLTLLVVSFVYTVLTYKTKWSYPGRFREHYLSAFLGFVGLLCSEEFNLSPKTRVGNVLLATWFIGIFVVRESYVGNLKASSSVVKFQTTDTFEDVVKQPKLRPIVFKGTYYETLFKQSDLAVNKKLYQMILKHNGALGIEGVFNQETMDDVANGKAVQIFDVIPLMFLISIIKCQEDDFLFSKNAISYHPVLFPINKNLSTEITAKLDKMFLLYASSVQLKRYLRQMEIKSSICMAGASSSVNTIIISIGRLNFATFLYFVCFTLSIITLSVELYTFLNRRRASR